MDELYKLVMTENSKRKKVAPKLKKVEKQEKHKIKQEVEQKVAVIRKEKKKEKIKAAKLTPKPSVVLKIGDRVRMLDGRAIGTIENIEKKKAFVDYGMFTTQVALTELEKVS